MSRTHSVARPTRRGWSVRGPVVVAMVLLLITGIPAHAVKPVATFSIVGFDPETGDLGVAVQSKFFAVGSVVPWAKAGVGAIATQAFANTTYGPEGLRLLESGKSPEEVIALLTEPDSARAQRQLGIVDARGHSAAFTGSECMVWAGHETGPDFTAQGNILTGQEVVAAMAKAFRDTEGPLGEKLMRAIEEGQRAGGDSRGMESAAMLIVRNGAGYAGFNDRYCDLRVDDHADPIAELRRIFDMWQWNALINDGYLACEEKKWDRAFAIAEQIMSRRPEDAESYYHPACFYSRAGNRERALELLAETVRRDPALGDRAAKDPDFKPLYEDPEFLKLTSGK